MQEQSIDERLKEIKRSFRLLMNGVASQSMREKGAEYHVNWGASFPMLKDMASGIGNDYELAQALWKENVRECKILATLVMPADKMTPENVDEWVEQTVSQEIVVMAAFNLYQHLPFVVEKAYGWIGNGNEVVRLCGFHTLSLLFKKGLEPATKYLDRYMACLVKALTNDSMAVRKAALSSAQWFMYLDEEHEKQMQNVLNGIGIELFS